MSDFLSSRKDSRRLTLKTIRNFNALPADPKKTNTYKQYHMSCFQFSGQTDITFEIGRNKAYYIRYLKFSACSRCFCIYLLVLDGFRFFDTWHAASVVCKVVAKIIES